MGAAFCVPWLVWAIVRVLGLEHGYPLVSMASFTPYVAATSLLPVVVACLLRRWWIAGFASVIALSLIGVVVPRALPNDSSRGSRGGEVLTVMSLNLHLARADPESVMRLVRSQRVQVLALQELGSALPQLDAAGADRLLPLRVLAPAANTRGSAILGARRLRLTPSTPENRRRATGALVLGSGQRVELEAVHPKAPTDEAAAKAWRQALGALPPAAEGGPLRLLAGDFNATLDHAQLRHLLGRGYLDAADETGAGLRTTWPVGGEWPPITVDHILVDRRIGVRDFSVHEIPGTDHRAVVAELMLPPE